MADSTDSILDGGSDFRGAVFAYRLGGVQAFAAPGMKVSFVDVPVI